MLYVMDSDVLKSDFVKLVHSIDGNRKRSLHPQKVRKSSKRQVQVQMEGSLSSMSSVVCGKEKESGKSTAVSERLTYSDGSEKNEKSAVEFLSNGVLRRIKSVKCEQRQKGDSADNTSAETRNMTGVNHYETDDNQILNPKSCESRHDADELKVLLSSRKRHKMSVTSGEDTVPCNKFSTCCDNSDGDDATSVVLKKKKKRKSDCIVTPTCCHEARSEKYVPRMVGESGEMAKSSLGSERNNSSGSVKNVHEEDSVRDDDIEVKFAVNVKAKNVDAYKCEPCAEIVNNPALSAGKNMTAQEGNDDDVLSEKASGSGQCLDRKLRPSETAHNHPSRIPNSCYVALDCEMVGVGDKGRHSRLARCSIVDYAGSVVYDSYVLPEEPITDYRTPWSGITRRHMQEAIPVNKALPEIKALLQDKIVIGHAVYNDFKVIHFQPPVHLVRDTASCRQLANMAEQGVGGRGLKRLSLALLGRRIQMGKKGHCSVEDARASLDLFKLVQTSWEAELFSKWRQKGLRVTAGLAATRPVAREEDYLQDRFWRL